MEEQAQAERSQRDQGFTLIELLIAVVIVGISSLVDSGESAACNASRDAAQAAGAVYYANTDGGVPASLYAMVGDELELAGGVTVAVDSNVMVGNGWSITYTPADNTFTACPA